MGNSFNPSFEKRTEQEKPLETEIRLEIFRHSKKENDPNRPNPELLLTPEGRELARDKGLELNPDINVSVAGASPMDRAAETAMLVMMSGEDNIKTGDSLEEMDAKIADELKVGKKIYRDERLGFNLNGPVHAEGMAAFKAGNYIDWLVKDSDRQAIEKGDQVSTTYLRQAGNIAELVERYSKIGNNFNHLADLKKQGGEEYTHHLERYLASHQAVVESFVAEVIKAQEGEVARDEFASTLKNGWAETEGISVRIVNRGPEQTIGLTYRGADGSKEIIVKPETLNKIISERADFEREVKGE
jgi:hypothetical protein